MINDAFEKNNEVMPEQSLEQADNNFFLTPDKSNRHREPIKHLNDYDYNILQEDAYRDVTDEMFKLEYKISKIEEDIQELNNQIQAAKDIRDFTLVEVLFNRKKMLQEDLDNLVKIYNDASLSAKISGSITGKYKQYISALQQVFQPLFDVFISKLPGKFSAMPEIKKSLQKLENINKNVDELIAMQAPYGDIGDKYEQLSKYIIRANDIQAEISKYIR